MQSRLTTSDGALNCALLRTFVRVVDTGNISGAARSLYVAQSAVSGQIATLNRLTGTLLLERVRGRWKTTAAGAIFYKRSREMLALLEQTERDLADATQQISGHLMLGSTRTITDTVLAGLVHAFAGDHPDIRVVVRAGNRDDAERWLANDDVDVALVALPLGLRNLEIYPFGRDELVVVLPLKSALAGREELAISELESQPFVAFERGSGVRALLEERLGERFSRLDLVMELNSTDALVSCVEREIGFAFLPRRVAARWARCGGVSFARVTDADLTRELALVARTERVRSQAASTFIRWLGAQELRDEGAELSSRDQAAHSE